MKLGILYKGGKIVNHRSLLKVLINPILRYFGYCIGTKCFNGKLGNICIIRQKRNRKIVWDFSNHNEYDYIIKKRIFI